MQIFICRDYGIFQFHSFGYCCNLLECILKHRILDSEFGENTNKKWSTTKRLKNSWLNRSGERMKWCGNWRLGELKKGVLFKEKAWSCDVNDSYKWYFVAIN